MRPGTGVDSRFICNACFPISEEMPLGLPPTSWALLEGEEGEAGICQSQDGGFQPAPSAPLGAGGVALGREPPSQLWSYWRWAVERRREVCQTLPTPIPPPNPPQQVCKTLVWVFQGPAANLADVSGIFLWSSSPCFYFFFFFFCMNRP